MPTMCPALMTGTRFIRCWSRSSAIRAIGVLSSTVMGSGGITSFARSP